MDWQLLRRMFGYVRPYFWPYFIGSMICMILFGSTNGIMPFLVRFIFDDVFTGKNADVLQVLPIAILGVFVFRGLMGFGSQYLSEWVNNQVINDLRNDLNAHIQDLSLSFFNQNATGGVISRVTSDVYVVGTALTSSRRSCPARWRAVSSASGGRHDEDDAPTHHQR